MKPPEVSTDSHCAISLTDSCVQKLLENPPAVAPETTPVENQLMELKSSDEVMPSPLSSGDIAGLCHGTSLRLGAQQRFGVKTMILCRGTWDATCGHTPIFNHLNSALNHLNFLGPATQCFGSKL